MVGVRSSQHAEERAEVEVLSAQAQNFADIGKKMKACLGRMEDNQLSEMIGPTYGQTQRLQIEEKNSDRLLASLKKMRMPLEGKAEDERVLQNDPALIGIDAYLSAIKRMEEKHAKMMESPMRLNEKVTRELREVLRNGSGKLRALFDAYTRENTHPVEPLHFLTKQLNFPSLSGQMMTDLATLDSFFSSPFQRQGPQNMTHSIQSYADARGRYLDSSLRNLAQASLSTSRKKNPDEIYRQGTSGIGTYVKGIEGLFLAEWLNILNIFTPEDRGLVFEATTRQALDELSTTLRTLDSQVKANIVSNCFLAFDILENVNSLAFRLGESTGQLRQQIFDIAKPVRDTAKSSLGDLLDNIRRYTGNLISLPPDASSINFTADTMRRTQTLLQYPATLSSLLTSIGDGNWGSTTTLTGSTTSLGNSSKPFDVSPNSQALIAHYIHDTLELLQSQLEQKARGLYKSKGEAGIFIANSIAVMERMTNASDLAPILQSTSWLSKAAAARTAACKSYLDTWKIVCMDLMDVQYTNRGGRPPSGPSGSDSIKSLSSKEKDGIKVKFQSFNNHFESLSNTHKGMLPGMEREVRAQLAREVQSMILPLYERFWDRYHELDKGKGKYVRYDKAGMNAALAGLG